MLKNLPQDLLELNAWTPVDGKKPLLKNWHYSKLSITNALNLSQSAKSPRVGLVFQVDLGLVGIDLDKCVDADGNIEDWAMDIATRIGSYTEYSQSGTGLHIVCRGKKPGPQCRAGKIEVYDSDRQFVMTGDAIDECGLEDGQEGLDWLYETYFKAPAPHKATIVADNVYKRAQAYIRAMPDSVEGENGSTALFRVALKLVRDFAMPRDQCMMLMCEYNSTKCAPPWEEADLIRKLDQAYEKGRSEFGSKLQEDPDQDLPEDLRKPLTVPLRNCVDLFLEELATGRYTRVSTGIRNLDEALKGGIRPGEFVIIQGRPSHGKTALALHLQEAFARSGYNVLLISREMSAANIGQRIMQRITGNEVEHDQLASSQEAWANSQDEFMDRIQVCDTAGDIDSVCRVVEHSKEWHDTQVIIVDYLQLVTPSGPGSAYEKATEVSKRLVDLKQDGATVIVLSQMSRSIEHRDSFTPKASDARDSGQIEQDADIHMTVMWDCKCKDKEGQPMFPDSEPNDYTIFVHKSRQSGIAKEVVHCKYNPASQLYDEPEVHYAEFDDYATSQPAVQTLWKDDEEV